MHNVISAYNRRIDRLESIGRFDWVPDKMTEKGAKFFIGNSQENWDIMVGQMENALLSHNLTSGDVVIMNGERVPRFVMDNMGLMGSAINDERDKVRDMNYPEWDSMSDVEKATAYANGNYAHVDVDGYVPSEEYGNLNWVFFHDERSMNYIENYLAAWDENLGGVYGDDGVHSIIERFMVENPEALKAVLERHDIEATIEFVYISSADRTPPEIRHSIVVNYWRKMEEKYLG